MVASEEEEVRRQEERRLQSLTNYSFSDSLNYVHMYLWLKKNTLKFNKKTNILVEKQVKETETFRKIRANI